VIRKLRKLWGRLRAHILFIPGLFVVLGIVLAVALVETDRRFETETIRQIPWLFRAGASGARDVLVTVATAMIQIAAITFSVTIVALAMRSQQFGPRLLKNFTSDKLNQAILGTFIGTFAYALLVLRAVRDLSEDVDLEAETFVPLLAVTGAIALALVSLAMFVVFIDRVVTSIQANSIIAQASEETHRAIDRLFPEPVGDAPSAADEDEVYRPLESPVDILAARSGYIQTLDASALIEAAAEADIVVRMEAPIGGFVVAGTPLATASPRERIDDDLIQRLRHLYTISRDRSVEDDPEFGVRQIVDVAVKALSPSDNDPTTACTATEFLGAVLIHFAQRSVPSPLRRDDDGNVRVIALGPTFRRMVNLAFDQIREHGEDDVALTLQLIETLIRVASVVDDEGGRAVLEEHVWKISRGAAQGIRDPIDRHAVNRRLEVAMLHLGRDEPDSGHYLIPLAAGD
jgi:uncharacterized membrane protein